MNSEPKRQKQSGRFVRAWFSWGLVACVLAALLAPRLGSKSGPLDTALWIRIGTVLVFFLHGARLPLSTLSSGVTAWRTQLVAQGVSFLLLPMASLVLGPFLAALVDPEARLGFLYLCALPTTVTSAAVLTAVARGNVAVAVVGSTLSGLLGVVLTPLWVTVLVPASGGRFVGDTVVVLLQLLVLPLCMGQLCRGLLLRWWRPRASARSSVLGRVWNVFAALDRGVVLFIVYTVFCDAFYTHLFDKFGAAELWWTAAASVALFVLSLAVAHALARWLAIDEDERIAVMFLGSTKSLAIGVPMAAVVFAARDNLGAVLLPLLLYHPLQLLLGGALAARLRDRPSGPARSIP